MSNAVDMEMITRDDLIRGNINPETYLATDYLNHFNELAMLLDLLADMPDMLDDVLEWQPKSYVEHFEQSQFAAKDLAVSAYYHAPDLVRQEFDSVVNSLDKIFIQLLDKLRNAPNEQFAQIISEGSKEAESQMAYARSVINGNLETSYNSADDFDECEGDDLQSSIDALFD